MIESESHYPFTPLQKLLVQKLSLVLVQGGPKRGRGGVKCARDTYLWRYVQEHGLA